MLKGLLEGCVLEIISWHPKNGIYGYEITKNLRENGFSEIVEGTIYAILMRLEKNNFVEISKKPSEIGPPRKFYKLNFAGEKELANFWRKWQKLSTKINELKEKK